MSAAGETWAEHPGENRPHKQPPSSPLPLYAPKPKKSDIVVYHPNDPWWEPPLAAWIPSTNRPIFFIYVTFVILLTLLARFTPYCGTPPASSSHHQFCSNSWLFDTDHILKFLSAGLFILIAFRGSNSYSKFWEGRCVWGSIWKVSVSTLYYYAYQQSRFIHLSYFIHFYAAIDFFSCTHVIFAT